MIAKYDTVSVSSHQVSTTLGNECVILELQAGTYFSVNDVGTAVWNYLQQPRLVSDVIAHIVTKYEVSADQAEAEILSFLQNLVDKGLVIVEEHGSTRQTP
jgi:Coenzyme PQQ synthesis protein D (PqqD)